MRIAVIGASGYVGQVLVPTLVAEGHEVVAIGRRRESLPSGDGIVPTAVDAADEADLVEALRGCAAVYYLVHSLAADEFRDRDRILAETTARAAATAGAERIVFLGGLGDEPDSPHLESRHEVGETLREGSVPVVELQAAVILGAGSVSFEMLRHIAGRLPFMVCPRWVRTRIQPIAERDLMAYLVQSLNVAPGIYEIGGADITSYRDMINAYARARGLHRRYIVEVPFLTPHLSAYWVDLITPVDRNVSHALIESLRTEVIVTHPGPTEAAFDVTPMGLDEAITTALRDQRGRVPDTVLERHDGVVAGVYASRVEVPLLGASPEEINRDFDRIGGTWAWYGVPLLWRMRVWAGRLVGERMRLRHATVIERGAHVDWWVVDSREPDELVLEGDGWFPGDAWLGWRIDRERRMLLQVGALRTKGVPGVLYWFALRPIHEWVFAAMARRRVLRALNAVTDQTVTLPPASGLVGS